jgi:hypothetical protein
MKYFYIKMMKTNFDEKQERMNDSNRESYHLQKRTSRNEDKAGQAE